MKNRRKTALAVRVDIDASGVQRWAVYERATGTVLSYYMVEPKRGCVGRTGLSKALEDIQIGDEVKS